ncbi:putative alpha-galactosidase B [Venturia inaequalis]|nr:putative alpha-galactosidase B [Venturia inaequalis]
MGEKGKAEYISSFLFDASTGLSRLSSESARLDATNHSSDTPLLAPRNAQNAAA